MNQDRIGEDKKLAGYRFHLGIIVFIVGFISPVFIPLDLGWTILRKKERQD